MKVWEWYFLVAIATALLIISFFTKNIYIAAGTFALGMYLKKHSKGIPLPKQFSKYKVVSHQDKKVFEGEEDK